MNKIAIVLISMLSLFVVNASATNVQSKFLGQVSIVANSQNGSCSSTGLDLDNDGILDAISIQDNEKTTIFLHPAHTLSSTSGIAKNEWYASFRDKYGDPLPQAINDDDPRPIVNMLIIIIRPL